MNKVFTANKESRWLFSTVHMLRFVTVIALIYITQNPFYILQNISSHSYSEIQEKLRIFLLLFEKTEAGLDSF